jgi:hypothetical protein
VNSPTHWIFPRGLMPFVDIAARNSGLTGNSFSSDTDEFGKRISKYKGLPILFGYEPDDSPDLLPFTEVGAGGGGAVTSSIYLARSATAAFTRSSRRRSPSFRRASCRALPVRLHPHQMGLGHRARTSARLRPSHLDHRRDRRRVTALTNTQETAMALTDQHHPVSGAVPARAV